MLWLVCAQLQWVDLILFGSIPVRFSGYWNEFNYLGVLYMDVQMPRRHGHRERCLRDFVVRFYLFVRGHKLRAHPTMIPQDQRAIVSNVREYCSLSPFIFVLYQVVIWAELGIVASIFDYLVMLPISSPVLHENYSKFYDFGC